MDEIPDDMPQADLKQEVNSRTHRAGYTTREGGPIPRKICSRTSKAYRDNYDKIEW